MPEQNEVPTETSTPLPHERQLAQIRLYRDVPPPSSFILDKPAIIWNPPELLPVSLPAPSVKHLEDEIRRLQGQALSMQFQPSESFLADFRRIYNQVKQTIEAIVESVRPAIRTLAQVFIGDFDLSPSRSHLSRQSRRYLMVKRREQARRMRHGRNRYA